MYLNAHIIVEVFIPIAFITSLILYRLNKYGFLKFNYFLNFGLCVLIAPLGWIYFLYSLGRFMKARKLSYENISTCKNPDTIQKQ